MNSENVGVRAAYRSALLSALLVLFPCPSRAFAQSGEARGPAREQSKEDGAYKDLIDQALTEFKLKNWPEARVLFRRAHELNPNARTLRGLGVVSFEMRDYQQAVQHLSAALVDGRQPLTDVQRSECDGLLARSRTFVGSYTLRLEPGAAQVTLDGSALVRDQDGLVLVPFGEHTLRGVAAGYQDGMLRVQVQGGERSELMLSLLPAGAAPVAAIPPPMAPMVANRELPAASEPASPAPLRDEKRGFIGGGLRYTWIAVGVGAVFGGAAVAFWYAGQGKLDDLEAQCSRRAAEGNPCARGDTNTDSIERFETLTNASLGVAAVGAVAAGVLVALEWPRERDLSVNVGLQSVSLRGSF
jgi:hypothetical protein